MKVPTSFLKFKVTAWNLKCEIPDVYEILCFCDNFKDRFILQIKNIEISVVNMQKGNQPEFRSRNRDTIMEHYAFQLQMHDKHSSNNQP